jgi:hypothetical protein
MGEAFGAAEVMGRKEGIERLADVSVGAGPA